MHDEFAADPVHTSPGPSRFSQPITKAQTPTPATAPTADGLTPPSNRATAANSRAATTANGPKVNAANRIRAELAPQHAQARNCHHDNSRANRIVTGLLPPVLAHVILDDHRAPAVAHMARRVGECFTGRRNPRSWVMIIVLIVAGVLCLAAFVALFVWTRRSEHDIDYDMLHAGFDPDRRPAAGQAGRHRADIRSDHLRALAGRRSTWTTWCVPRTTRDCRPRRRREHRANPSRCTVRCAAGRTRSIGGV